jgi:hypothetical protein
MSREAEIVLDTKLLQQTLYEDQKMVERSALQWLLKTGGGACQEGIRVQIWQWSA